MLSLACHRRAHSTCELWPLCDCACHPENKGIDDLDRESLHKLYVKHAQSKYYQTWCQKNIERYGAARSDRRDGAARSDRLNYQADYHRQWCKTHPRGTRTADKPGRPKRKLSRKVKVLDPKIKDLGT